MTNIPAVPLVLKRPKGEEPWREFGCDQTTYETWASEVCSIACVRSLILAQRGQAPTLWSLTEQAISKGVFRFREERILGAFHYPLSQLLRDWDLKTEVFSRFSEDEIWEASQSNYLLLSVELSKFSDEHHGGHIILVLAHGPSDREYTVHDSAGLIGDDPMGTPVPRDFLAKCSNGKGVLVKHLKGS